MAKRMSGEIIALARALHRQMPVSGCHGSRGHMHSEDCYQSCFDSWQRCVQDVAHTLNLTHKDFDTKAWVALTRWEGVTPAMQKKANRAEGRTD